MSVQSKPTLNPYVQFGICVGGIYVSFLVWALCQERLTTTPYLSTSHLLPTNDKFRSVVFINAVQALFSVFSAFIFLFLTKRNKNNTSSRTTTWKELVGLPTRSNSVVGSKNQSNGTTPRTDSPWPLLSLYAFIALTSSLAAPFGFLSLSHLSFPTLLLGKSCKLVPVMMMNVVLYRRKFPLHKYLLVGLVTVGIWAFMAFKPVSEQSLKKGGGGGSNSLLGLTLLGINLMMDGIVNATQDQVFTRYRNQIDGPQMMFFMNLFSFLFMSISLFIPFSFVPSSLLPLHALSSTSLRHHTNEFSHAIEFIKSHDPQLLRDILLFSLTGSLGQLFIFLTLSLYGSLTLVTITVTRKMVTMLLSVFVFGHDLSRGQWVGVGLVFFAVAVEAVIARREKMKGKTSGDIKVEVEKDRKKA